MKERSCQGVASDLSLEHTLSSQVVVGHFLLLAFVGAKKGAMVEGAAHRMCSPALISFPN